jgi:hypothetical protein
MKKLRVAFVYDRITKFGGAERVLMAMHDIWPEAPIYTAVYDPEGAPWAKRYDIIPSFLQKIPFAKHHHEWLAWATPMAFETFNFNACYIRHVSRSKKYHHEAAYTTYLLLPYADPVSLERI